MFRNKKKMATVSLVALVISAVIVADGYGFPRGRGRRGFFGGRRGFAAGRAGYAYRRPVYGRGLGWTGRFGTAFGYGPGARAAVRRSYRYGWYGYGYPYYRPYYYRPYYYGYGYRYPYYGGYPYYGWGGYSYPRVTYNVSPGRYLSGMAQVYNAQGNLLVKQAEAAKRRQEAERVRLENRRRTLEQAEYERRNRPTETQVRQQKLEERYQRSLTNPPYYEIVSGKALNDIAAGMAAKGLLARSDGTSTPLNPDLLRHINVRKADTRISSSAVSSIDSLTWPEPLQGPTQKKLDQLFAEAVGQVRNGSKVEPDLLQNISDNLEKLQAGLETQLAGGDMSASTYINSKKFVRQLWTAHRALKQPNAAAYFGDALKAKGQTVQELLRYMQANQLEFGPARTPEQEEAYAMLHRLMVLAATREKPVESGSSFRLRLPPTPASQ